MKAALYCRLSREDTAGGESESIQNQRAMLLDYARTQGYQVYKIYIDEDYSGMDRSRPAFCALLRDAEAGQFEVVLAKTQSRFTRDMELVEKYLHGCFPAWGVRFLALVDHVDTEDAAGKKARQVSGLVNEWYLEDLSHNVRAVLDHKRQQGQYIGAFALYGYRKDPQNKNHLLVDETAAAVVRRIFALALSGWGPARIAQLLNAEKVPSPSLYKQRKCLGGAGRGSGLWSRGTIYQMLHNETYTGNLVQGRQGRLSYKSKKTVRRAREDWYVCAGTHAALVSAEEFARVQGQHTAYRPEAGGRVHPLAGLVRCGVCGAVMEKTASGTRKKDGTRTQYWRCRTHSRCAEGCCANYVPVAVVERAVYQRVRNQLSRLPPAALHSPGPPPESHQRQTLQAEWELRARALATLYLEKERGALETDAFERMRELYRRQQKQLREELEALDERTCGKEKSACGEMPDLLQSESWPRELLCRLVRAVYVIPQEGGWELTICWNF